MSDFYILAIGEHDKGLGEPFPTSTVAGRRLRAITADLPVPVVLTNMMDWRAAGPSRRDLRRLSAHAARAYAVVFLGRRVEASLACALPRGIYLPHPAARSTKALSRLRHGLSLLASHVSLDAGGNPWPLRLGDESLRAR